MTSKRPQSELEQIIAPEILNDEFHALITRLASTVPARHILEIGSSAGGGSTSAFVAGIRKNPARPTLHCMEVSKARFDVLKKTYAKDPFVRCHNVSSVGVDEFPSEAQVAEFYNTTPTALNQYDLPRVLGWLRQDIEYIQTAGVPQDRPGADRRLRIHGIRRARPCLWFDVHPHGRRERLQVSCGAQAPARRSGLRVHRGQPDASERLHRVPPPAGSLTWRR
jgi:hypothetical protein